MRPGTVLGSGPTIAKLADMPEVQRVNSAKEAVERIQADLREFRDRNKLDHLVVANVSSTEPPKDLDARYDTIANFRAGLERPDSRSESSTLIPASALYAWAALDLGLPYVNFTPSLGASFPAAVALANQRKTTTCGKDGKTGETLMTTVLAPMFAYRNSSSCLGGQHLRQTASCRRSLPTRRPRFRRKIVVSSIVGCCRRRMCR